jgi:hypothetical protein
MEGERAGTTREDGEVKRFVLKDGCLCTQRAFTTRPKREIEV